MFLTMTIWLMQKLQRSRKENPAMVKAVLHLGAHRCATTTFQSYLDLNRSGLEQCDVTVWTPSKMREDRFQGLFSQPCSGSYDVGLAQENLRSELDALHTSRLLISEENMIGAPRDNLNSLTLYPGFSPRLERFQTALAGHITQIGLSIRSYESYWASLLSFAVLRGHELPNADQTAELARQPRRWVQLVAELRNLFPRVPLKIQQFEDFASRPDQTLTNLLGRLDQELNFVAIKKNYSRDTQNLRRLLRIKGREADANQLPKTRQRWMPFNDAQQAQMKLAYAQDVEWLEKTTDPYISFIQKAAQKVPRRPDTGDRHDLIQKMGRNRHQGTAWQAP